MKKRNIVSCIMLCLLLAVIALLGNTETAEAAHNCGSCKGLGYRAACDTCGTISSSVAISGNKGQGGCTTCNTLKWFHPVTCTTCNGNKTFPCTPQSDYSFKENNGIANGEAYKNCTGCGARMETLYGLWIHAGNGIASVTGTGWYAPGSTAQVTCSPHAGYHFTTWSDGDTRQNWPTVMDRAKSFTAYGAPNVYTMTMYHHTYNVDTGGWTHFATTTAQAAYGSVFTPSYSTTPTGYYNYSMDWAGGWTVTGDGGFYVYYHPNLYSVTYHDNGGTGGPAAHNFYYNSTAYLSWTQPVRPGYSFSHWTVNENGVAMSPGQQIPIGWGGFNLTAQWTPNQYTFTVHPNGGTFGDGTTEIRTADPNLLYDAGNWWHAGGLVPTRKGYTFEGFYDALSGGTKVYDSTGACVQGTQYWNYGNMYCYPGNLYVYAQWSQNEYTVTYDANGGTTDTQTGTFHYNEEVDLSLTAEKEGKLFVGWSTDPDATTAMNTLIMPDLATSDDPNHADWEITLYAVYSIPVSDVANHSYPDYDTGQEKDWEVFVRIYDFYDETNYRDYQLDYVLDTNAMVYRYRLDEDISDFVKDMDAYYYKVYAYDNAENGRVVYEDVVIRPDNPTPPPPEIPETENPMPEKYQQTVEHYKYNPVTGRYEKFTADVRVEMEENSIFTPKYVLPPKGYEKDHMEYPDGYESAGKIQNGSYAVTEDAICRAYYRPCKYGLTFDANDGGVNRITGKITYNDRYGRVGFDYNGDGVFTDAFGFPTPVRDGYTFDGWYTKETDGTRVKSTDTYLIADDSTLYAHWKKNSYNVIYDFATNGGTEASAVQKSHLYEAGVDLSVAAKKVGDGWEFVGWNTNPNAVSGLSVLSMPAHDVTLYAIFKKNISVTVKERGASGTVETKLKKTIYNQETKADFIITSALSEAEQWPGWNLQGWTTETGATEDAFVGRGSTYTTSIDSILYGVYTSKVTLDYDTKGSTMYIEPLSKACYYNASGESEYPEFTVVTAPVLSGFSFVNWKITDGIVLDNNSIPITHCAPGDEITLQTDATLTVSWDAHPVIEAYNRHFTLEQAKSSAITEAELLAKVRGTDEEAKTAGNPDGVLQNGVAVVVKNYRESDFTGITTDKEIYITYQATDSFGTVVEKSVTVTITDTTMKKSSKKNYVRFISKAFFEDDTGNLVSADEGGLEETSIWRWNVDYRNLLKQTLFRLETNEEKESWTFTREEIKAIKKKCGIS